MLKKLYSFLLISLIFSSYAAADDVRVYFNHPVNPPAVQANLEDKVINLINSANGSLYMAIYDLDLANIANAMVAAKNRGVDVRFITDNDNIGVDNAEVISILNAGNVPWIDDTENGSAGSKIQHNKFIIVDGKFVLTGSTNLSQSGVHGDLNADGILINKGNDNHIVIIESTPLALIFKNQFNVMWGDGPGGLKDSLFGLGKPDHTLQTVITDNDNIRIDVQFTPQSPTLFKGSTLYNLVNYINNSHKLIYLSQFVISSQDVVDAMKVQHDLGVEVKGIGDSSFFYRYYSEFQDMLGNAIAKTDGTFETDSYTGAPNNIWQNPVDVRVANLDGGDKWHHKYWIIDDIVITGSHNTSGAAAFGNDENVVAIYDIETTNEFTSHFNRSFCEAGNGLNCGVNYQGGTWEGVIFTAVEVAAVIDIVNNATFTQLDIDAALNKTAVKNIIAARPVTSMDQLALISYVGPAALKDLKMYSSSW
jgi:phosphatidylserine/phosphatidylglycerophosphate/cardiolipin synthase-like enzyme